MSQLKLLGQKRFLPLFLTQFLGAMNDNIFKNALVILIIYKASTIMGLPSSQVVVLAGGLFILPFFLFSATAGKLADKYEKSSLIKATKVAEVIVMGLGAIGFLTQHYEFLLVTLFLMGTQSTIFGPLKYSILPQHLSDQELVGGNALIEAGTFIAILVGTILGGIFIADEQSGPMMVSVIVIIVAVLGLVTSLSIPKAPSNPSAPSPRWNVVSDTIDIIKISRKNQNVFYAVMANSWFWLFGSCFLSLFPVYAKETLNGNESVVTLLLATFSVGIAIGSLLCEMMSRQRIELGLVPFGSLGMSIFAVDLYFASSMVATGSATALSAWEFFAQSSGKRILFDLLMLSVFSGFFIVPLYAYIQLRTPADERSRVIAATNIMNALFMVVGSICLAGFMKMSLGPKEIFLVLAAMNAVVATYIYFFMPEFLLRFYAWCITRVMYRLKVNGHQNIPTEGPCVLICNHVTYVDWLILAAAVKRPARFIMDHSFYKGWIQRNLLNQAKVIPIASAKENPEVLERAFARMAEELRAGEVVCIFPEGKLTYDGNLNPFRPGIERILKDTPVPVIPMALHNVWGSFFSRKGGKAIKKLPRRFWSAIELDIGALIPPEQVTAAMLQEKVQTMLDNPPKDS